MNKDKLVVGSKVVGEVFKDAFIKQLESEDTWISGAAVGFAQGMKYNGNVKRGLKAAVSTVTVVAVGNGLINVIKNKDAIKEIVELKIKEGI